MVLNSYTYYMWYSAEVIVLIHSYATFPYTNLVFVTLVILEPIIFVQKQASNYFYGEF